MLELFIKVISPFFIFLSLIILYSYVTGQSGQDLIDTVASIISTIIYTLTEVFNRG